NRDFGDNFEHGKNISNLGVKESYVYECNFSPKPKLNGGRQRV
ncbi:unnamed protein product, partial [Allacma fusca]